MVDSPECYYPFRPERFFWANIMKSSRDLTNLIAFAQCEHPWPNLLHSVLDEHFGPVPEEFDLTSQRTGNEAMIITTQGYFAACVKPSFSFDLTYLLINNRKIFNA